MPRKPNNSELDAAAHTVGPRLAGELSLDLKAVESVQDPATKEWYVRFTFGPAGPIYNFKVSRYLAGLLNVTDLRYQDEKVLEQVLQAFVGKLKNERDKLYAGGLTNLLNQQPSQRRSVPRTPVQD